MRNITFIAPNPDFTLNVQFENGIQKVLDVKPFLSGEAFTALKNYTIFSQAESKGSYILWPNDIDLSADTVWHEGK